MIIQVQYICKCGSQLMFDTKALGPDMWYCPDCNTRYEKNQLTKKIVKKDWKLKTKKGDKVMAKKAECIICGTVKTIIGRGRCGGCYARGKKVAWATELEKKQYANRKNKGKYTLKNLKKELFKNKKIKTGYTKEYKKIKSAQDIYESTREKYIIVSRDTPELTAAELLNEVMLGHTDNMKVLKTQ